MKIRAKIFILSTTLWSAMMLTGCDKPQDATATLEPGSTMGVEVKDSEVTVKVKTALLLDEKIKGFNIAVVTLKGDVRLTGVVDTQSQIDQVHKIVRGIDGVHSIHDELSIRK